MTSRVEFDKYHHNSNVSTTIKTGCTNSERWRLKTNRAEGENLDPAGIWMADIIK
jgi:hypothetical protein